jgi:hypothetical protein
MNIGMNIGFTRILGLILGLVAALSTAGLATEASAQARVKAGTLTCNLAPTVGLIVASKQRLSCHYTPDGPWPPEFYYGSFTTVGVDIGIKGGGRLVWAVFAPVNTYYHGALAGTYVGASADVAVGVGLGANALVGGSHRSFALQPLSVEGNVGFNVAGGVSRLRLHVGR